MRTFTRCLMFLRMQIRARLRVSSLHSSSSLTLLRHFLAMQANSGACPCRTILTKAFDCLQCQDTICTSMSEDKCLGDCSHCLTSPQVVILMFSTKSGKPMRWLGLVHAHETSWCRRSWVIPRNAGGQPQQGTLFAWGVTKLVVMPSSRMNCGGL